MISENEARKIARERKAGEVLAAYGPYTIGCLTVWEIWARKEGEYHTRYVVDSASNKPEYFDSFGDLSQLLTVHCQHFSRSPLSTPNVVDTRKVFVVHGRNSAARDALFTFLRSIGLHPIEWSEATRLTGITSPYIGEILEAAFAVAQAVVVLMTPDDVAYLQSHLQQPGDATYETTPTPQTRPNVLFEAGMAMGRFPDRTVLVQIGDIRPFSDIGGRHVIRLNNTSQRRQDLADRLTSAGCSVNIRDRDWHTTGDFDSAIQSSVAALAQSTASGGNAIALNIPQCPNCSTKDKPFFMSPIPKDFVEIENATHECAKCHTKIRY